MKDLYTIQTLQTTPHKDLKKIVKKHVNTVFQRPIPSLQQAIFSKVYDHIKQAGQPIILDVGCGTGRSTLQLAEQQPEHWVIGIDKSLTRLNRNVAFRQSQQLDNALLVQANSIDFWRLAVEAQLPVVKQYLLYSNPYPKASQLTKRWHGHPVFPVMMQLGKTIEVRSNWRIYLEEFQTAANMVGQFFGTIQVMQPFTTPLTNFEKKYWQEEIRTYQLILHRV